MKAGFVMATFVVALSLCAHAFGTITIDTVPIGDAGNPRHFTYGRVDYAYRIGTYEVTVGQYATFLNAVAATDTYGAIKGVRTGQNDLLKQF